MAVTDKPRGGFWFAEQFGPDYATQRANIERYRKAGRARKDAEHRLEALRIIVIELNGKPRWGEPARIARDLGLGPQRVNTVRGWIEDYQRKVDYLVEHGRVSRAQAWALLKNPSPWADVERGMRRSEAGRKAGSVIPRRRSGW